MLIPSYPFSVALPAPRIRVSAIESSGGYFFNSYVNIQGNNFCWKCNKILDESKSREVRIRLIKQDDEINKVKHELDDIKRILKGLSELILTD